MGIADTLLALAPSWLQDGGPGSFSVGGRTLYALGLMCDTLLDKMDIAMKEWMPKQATPDALEYIGADRNIPQGPNEPAANYALRLQRAFDSWHIAGSNLSIFQQLQGFFNPLAPTMRSVNDSSLWNYLIASASSAFAPTVYQGSSNWNWDGEYDPHLPSITNMWWRWWLVLFATSPNAFAASEGNWGDHGATWGDSVNGSVGAWGLNVQAAYITSLRTIVGTWKSANTWCRWIIVSFDSTLFDPNQTNDDVHNPNGDFAHWSKTSGQTVVPARFSSARYCDGIATVGNGLGTFPTY